jgi:hypothetical protein
MFRLLYKDFRADWVKTVEAALRECAGISVRDFSLVVTLENGEEKTFSSVSLAPYRQRIFTQDFYVNYRRAVRRANPDGSYCGSGTSHSVASDEKSTY